MMKSKKVFLLLLIVSCVMLVTGCDKSDSKVETNKENGKSNEIMNATKFDVELSDVELFSEGYAAVKDAKTNLWGLIDKNGNKVIDFKYKIADSFSEGLAYVDNNGKRVYIDRTGKIALSLNTNNLSSWPDFKNGYAIAKKNYKEGVIDKKGNFVVEPIYDSLHPYSDGLFTAKKNKKWGYIDIKGNVVIDFKFDRAFNFSEGYARVQLKGKEGFIDKKGNDLTGLIFELFHGIDAQYVFNEGYASVTLNKKYGFIDTTGKVVFGHLDLK